MGNSALSFSDCNSILTYTYACLEKTTVIERSRLLGEGKIGPNKVYVKEILFCTNFSESSHKAFTHALGLAKIHHAKLLIFHVTPDLVYSEQLSFYLPSNNWKS